MSYEDKVWAKRAAGLRLTEVERVQAAAEKWRNGLVALTTILTAVTIVKGPETFSDLSTAGRAVVSILLGLALLVLLVGSASSMRAAFGFPPEARLMSSSTLKQWSTDEARTATRLLRVATVSFFVAIPLVFAATAVMWFDESWFATNNARAVLVVVERDDGVDPAKPCGVLVTISRSAIELERGANDPIAGHLVIPLAAVRAVAVVDVCPDT